jgi:hypothetical protein
LFEGKESAIVATLGEEWGNIGIMMGRKWLQDSHISMSYLSQLQSIIFYTPRFTHSQKSSNMVHISTVEDILRHFPGIVSNNMYPKPVSSYEVDFELTDTRPICRKTYHMAK